MSGSDDVMQVWLDVGLDGSVTLPAACLAAAQLEPGGRVMVRVVDGVVQILSHMTLAMEIQRMIEKGIDPGPVLKDLPGVDGLIVERRLEFLREKPEFGAQHHAAE
ncbi:hypothetical protein HNR60_000586 [Rhodopseudomonas rhenobacensis]|uniref:Uncharacterized protein n=1 Tax=Rhodopseudomonas rhenobacensis TaxID=87461 RepID=A0A7W7Z0Q5_9BRAD|nr:hypothetical protein [Rhodopseudomonas rhenobacensis]MBB5045851.1 hypothetical protein [Rhodopseudomonas rhenobacensis]